MPNDAIRDLILDEIEVVALPGISVANGFWTTVRTVKSGHLSPLEYDPLPMVGILPVQELPDHGAGVTRWTLTVTLRLWIDADAPQPRKLLGRLIGDVQRRMLVDRARGGQAQDTRLGPVQFIYLIGTETIAGADVAFEIEYRTRLTDPAAQP